MSVGLKQYLPAKENLALTLAFIELHVNIGRLVGRLVSQLE